MNNPSFFLGGVQNGGFVQMWPEPAPGVHHRFTTIAPMEARPPESGELPLDQYEGGIIMIQGFDHGDWVYQAQVVDQAGPILSTLVVRVFGGEG